MPGVKGNIHTGATPPWLREDSCDDDASGSKPTVIGPSLEDFILHSMYMHVYCVCCIVSIGNALVSQLQTAWSGTVATKFQ